MRRLPLLAALMLAGCASAAAPPPVAPPPAPAVVIRLQCLPLANYTPEQQKKAAAELQSLPQGSELGAMMVDYGALRSADRACQRSSAGG